MNTWTTRLLFAAILLAIAPPALAHHVMDGATPVTFAQGFLSGLAHPVLGLDHLGAVIAVGCLAAAHRSGIGLAGGFVLAMVVGAAVHARGLHFVATEVLLACAVIVLGIAIQFRDSMNAAAMIALFTVAGLLSGYTLGETIMGAQPGPLSAYFVGLALVQLALAIAVMWLTRRFAMRPYAGVAMNVRLIGAAVIGIGFSAVVTAFVSNA